MQVDIDQFMKDGYVIIPECIPADQLESLRKSFDTLVERQKAIWASEAKPGEPAGGFWETSAQPRLWYDHVVDASTADAIDFTLHENTMGVSRQLMDCDEAATVCFFLMCSPVKDHGPAAWHRDIHPKDQAPLTGLERDILDNAPGVVQWNVPLYDDSVLWVVPGSHRRPNTQAENEQLLKDRTVPLPNSIPVELKAGDGVAYTNTIFHWGSNYSSKLRRTIHFGHRAFGGHIYPYVPHFYWTPDLLEKVSPTGRELLGRFGELRDGELNRVTSLFRALIDRDEQTFLTELARIHPGEEQRIVAVIQLSKFAFKIHFQPEGYGHDLMHSDEVASRFSEEERAQLWERFAPLDAVLQTEEDQFTPGFQSQPMKYTFEEMPEGFGVEEFVESWRE